VGSTPRKRFIKKIKILKMTFTSQLEKSIKLKRIEKTLAAKFSLKQGDQIGRIFIVWAIFNLGHFDFNSENIWPPWSQASKFCCHAVISFLAH
jgi:hypothetical protein